MATSSNRAGKCRTMVVSVGLVLAAGCSGGGQLGLPGGGGGGGGGSISGELELTILEEATYLTKLLGDVRTSLLLRFAIAETGGAPIPGLDNQSFEFFRDGAPVTSESIEFPTGSLAKVDLSLLLDNSASIAFDPFGTPTPQNVQLLRDGAIAFLDSVVDDADVLRIYRFSVGSKTELVGAYQSDGTAWGPGSKTGMTPAEDVLAYIDPNPAEDLGTALFQCVDLALNGDPEQDDILVLFSDGIEEGSKPGSKAAALSAIDQQQSVVYSIGIGQVDPQDLKSISENGAVYAGSDFASLEVLFEVVADQVESIYTVVLDTPLQDGGHDVLMRVTEPGGKQVQYETSFLAGLDLVLGGFGGPLVPGSSWQFEDAAGQVWKRTVKPLSQALEEPESGLLHMLLQSTDAPGATLHLATRGEGVVCDLGPASELAQVVELPLVLDIGTRWRIASGPFPIDGEVTKTESITVNGDSYSGCRVVERIDVLTGIRTHRTWYARGIGAVRSTDLATGSVLYELVDPPFVAGSFD